MPLPRRLLHLGVFLFLLAPCACGDFFSSKPQSDSYSGPIEAQVGPDVQFQEPSLYFGQMPPGSLVTRVIELYNSGTRVASNIHLDSISAPFAMAGGSFPGTNGSCGAELLPGRSCSVMVTYNPQAPAIDSGRLVVAFTMGGKAMIAVEDLYASATGGLTPTSSLPALIASAKVGQSVGGYVSLANTSSGPVSNLHFSIGAGSDLFSLTGGDTSLCPDPTPASSTCVVQVFFTPKRTGDAPGTLVASYTSGGSVKTETIPIMGHGSAPARLVLYSISPSIVTPLSQLNFGNTPTGSQRLYYAAFKNEGDFSAANLSVVHSPASPFSIQFDSNNAVCPSVSVGDYCNVTFSFKPTVNGENNDTFSMTYSDGAGGISTLSFSLKGAGISPATGPLVLSAGNPTLPAIVTGNAESQSLTLTNSGSTTISGLALNYFTGSGFLLPGGSFYSAGTCTDHLAPSQSCSFTVTFSPLYASTFSEALELEYSAGGVGYNFEIRLSAKALAPAKLVFEQANYFYGTFVSGAQDHVFIVDNKGGVATTVGLPVAPIGAHFQFKGGAFPGTGGTCNQPIQPNSSCTILAQFVADTAGAYTGTITLGYQDGVKPQTTSAYVFGNTSTEALALEPTQLAISEGPRTFDFGFPATGATIEHTFTLTNTGSSAIQGLQPDSLAAGFTFKNGSFGSSGNCGTTLAAGSSCQTTVVFHPAATGHFSAQLSLHYTGGASEVAVRFLVGDGKAAASAGALDTSFGAQGIVVGGVAKLAAHSGAGMDYFSTALVRQPDGKILTLGLQEFSTSVLSRFTRDGSPDLTFGEMGSLVLPFVGLFWHAMPMLLQPDGKIVLGGGGKILRLNPDGTVDKSFGTDGMASVGTAADNYVTALALEASGKILGAVLASSTNSLQIYRFTSSGALDTSFGAQGIANLGAGHPYALAVLPTRKILVGGDDDPNDVNHPATSSHFFLARMNADGSRDTSFTAATVAGLGRGFFLDGAGRVLMSGYDEADLRVARFTVDGALDPTFGTGGIVTADADNMASADGTSVAVDSAGHVYLLSQSDSLSLCVRRYLSSGQVDASFNGGQRLTYHLSIREWRGAALGVIGPDDKLVGFGSVNLGSGTFGAFRVWP